MTAESRDQSCNSAQLLDTAAAMTGEASKGRSGDGRASSSRQRTAVASELLELQQGEPSPARRPRTPNLRFLFTWFTTTWSLPCSIKLRGFASAPQLRRRGGVAGRRDPAGARTPPWPRPSKPDIFPLVFFFFFPRNSFSFSFSSRIVWQIEIDD